MRVSRKLNYGHIDINCKLSTVHFIKIIMSCDIIIPVFNQRKYTEGCIESIKKNTASDYRIIIIDDKSNDPEMLSYLGELKDDNIRIVRNEKNLGWVGSVNRGIKESNAEYVCVMNNDTIVADGWLDEMIRIAQREADIGLVNPEWEKPERVSIADYARSLKKYSGEFIETDWVRGFCFLVKREVVNRIGGLDEAYSPGYYDDCDYSVRALRAGFRPVLARASYVYHYRNRTHESVLKKEGMDSLLAKHKELFCQRWGRPLRIAFIFSGKIIDTDKNIIKNLLLKLVRDQHHLYLWAQYNQNRLIQHTNFKLSLLPKFLIWLFALGNIINNLGRSMNKRYDIIYINDKRLAGLFSMLRLNKCVKIIFSHLSDSSEIEQVLSEVESIKNERKIISRNLN